MFPLLILTAALVSMGVEGTGRRVCYFTNWSQYRPGEGKYLPSHINATLCTHIAIAFGKITDTLGPFEWNDESTPYREGTFDQIVKLKKSNPGLKVLLSVGGWNAHSTPFNRILESEEKTKMFAVDAAAYLRKKDMDGLDVDWEYPTDKKKYNTFIQTLKDAFNQEALKSEKERLLLTSAVPAGKSNIDKGFDVPFVSKLMDFITVMTYDLHGSWEKYTGHHSAMYAGNWETGPERYLNVDWIMDYWHKLGVPKAKLNLGLPTYGRCFTLESINNDGVNVMTKGSSRAGKYTREKGFLSYYEICKMVKDGAQRKYIQEQKVPYIVKGDQWCGYDDIESLQMKVNYAKSSGLGGIAVWSMALDDFNGICGPKYPLMTAIFNEMTRGEIQRYPTKASPEKESTSRDYEYTHNIASDDWDRITTTTTKPLIDRTIPLSKDSAGPCNGNMNGMYPDALSCKYFWICIPGFGGNRFNCPPGTLFDAKVRICNHEHLVKCKISADPCFGKGNGFISSADCKTFWICSNGKGYEKECPKNTLWNQKLTSCDWEYNVICSPSSQI